VKLSEIARRTAKWPQIKRHRHFRLAISLSGCFVCVFVATLLMSLFNRASNGMGDYLFWVANGTLLAYLLLTPRWRWPLYLCVGFAAMFAGTALTNGHIDLGTVVQSGLNLCEVLLGALLLRRKSTDLPRFADMGYFLRFLGFAAIAAPAAIGSLFTLTEVLMHHSQARSAFVTWTVADGLGTIVITPALVAILQSRLKSKVNWSKHWIYPTALVALTIAAFAQSAFPLLFLIYPLLVLTLLRVGLGLSTISLLIVAFTSGTLTLRGLGPFAALAKMGLVDPSVMLQLFAATGMFIL
jgi:integral membrane sensor domain MASE1